LYTDSPVTDTAVTEQMLPSDYLTVTTMGAHEK